jgi:hypothetical protein
MSKLVLEQYIKLMIESEADQDKPKTFGDLKKALKTYVEVKGRKEKIVKRKDIGKSAVKLAIDFIPYAGAVINSAELLGKMMNMPDEKRPEGFLSNFDLDDYTSKIVDNNIEAEFLKYLIEKIENTSDDKLIKDFDMTVELNNYLKQNYGGRSVKKT